MAFEELENPTTPIIQTNDEHQEESKTSTLKVFPKKLVSQVIKKSLLITPENVTFGDNFFVARCKNDHDAAVIENSIVENWFKAAEKVLIENFLDPSEYQKGAVLSCSIENGVLTINF